MQKALLTEQSPENSTNGEKIFLARSGKGLSRQEVHRILGIPVRTLEDWESNRRTPPTWETALIVEKIQSL